MLRIPDGFLDLSPERAEVFYFVKEKIFSLLKAFGFSPIIPPSVEFIETYKLSKEEDAYFFNYIDHYSGKPACFRYDFTPQIARFLSTRDKTKIYKLFYDGSVLRNEKQLSGRMREIFQSGVEIINIPDIHADIHLIVIIKKIISELNLQSAEIHINDVNILKTLLSNVHSDGLYIPLKSALIVKDLTEVENIISRMKMDNKRKEFILNLPFMCGGLSVLDEIKKYSIREIEPFISALRKIYDEACTLSEGNIIFDLGEFRSFEYHSGLIFDVFASNHAGHKEIITGGRYDNLLENYTGTNMPATGFAINIFNLTEVISSAEKKNIAIFTSMGCLDRAIKIANKLNSSCYRAWVELKDNLSIEKDFDLAIEIYNNNILALSKNKKRKIKLSEKDFEETKEFEESIKEIL